MSLLNSVNTNMGAMIALQSLNQTNTNLAAAEKQVSTGYRVADSTDDGAAYAIAQGVRSTVGALTTANQQLGNVQGLLSTTQSGLNDISGLMSSMRDVLTNLASGGVTGNDQANYIATYQSLLKNLKSDVQDATYSGKTLIGNITAGGGNSGTFANMSVVRNEIGAQYTVATFGGSAVYASLNYSTISLQNAAFVQSAIGASATAASFMNKMNSVNNELNTIGAAVNYVNNQVSYNSDKIDALNSGLGSLVDANLAQESAQLQALQIRQQLGTQALSLANQAPQSLLSLFK
jgi:flagellin